MPLSRINNNSIANNTIVAADLAAGSVTGDKIGATAINANNIVSGTITTTQIASNTVSNTNIQTGAIEAYSSSRSTGLFDGMRNRIINGAMVIDQRNAGAAVTINTTSNTYTIDRWTAAGAISDGVFTVQQSSTVPAGFTNSLKVTVTTADASIGSNQSYIISQFIEGFNVADLGWGTANAKTITVSFWVQSSVIGTFGGVLNNSSNNRNYPFTYAINVANTWEYKTVTIAGDTTGTWLTDSGRGIALRFGFGIGSDYLATAGAWTSTSSVFGATGQTQLISTLNATWYITGVQLEVGSTATSFDYRPYGTELALCQGYFFKSNMGPDAVKLGSMYNASLNRAFIQYDFHVTMRATPSITYTIGTGTLNYEYLSPDFVQIYLNTTTHVNIGSFTASSEL